MVHSVFYALLWHFRSKVDFFSQSDLTFPSHVGIYSVAPRGVAPSNRGYSLQTCQSAPPSCVLLFCSSLWFPIIKADWKRRSCLSQKQQPADHLSIVFPLLLILCVFLLRLDACYSGFHSFGWPHPFFSSVWPPDLFWVTFNIFCK